MKDRSLQYFVRGWGPLLVLAFATHANGAKLKPETVLAWDDYLQGVNTVLQNRLDPAGSFLWTFEDDKRAAKVRAGEIVVAPAPGQVPKKVPGGLIHHLDRSRLFGKHKARRGASRRAGLRPL